MIHCVGPVGKERKRKRKKEKGRSHSHRIVLRGVDEVRLSKLLIIMLLLRLEKLRDMCYVENGDGLRDRFGGLLLDIEKIPLQLPNYCTVL